MKKVRHDKKFVLKYEGQSWVLDVAEWHDDESDKGELRVYRVEGNVTTPLLHEALELEAQSRALSLMIASELEHRNGT